MQSALLIWEGNAECLWEVHTAAMLLPNNVHRDRDRQRIQWIHCRTRKRMEIKSKTQRQVEIEAQ